jgi:soluble lytic murein transglycosylase-like protein
LQVHDSTFQKISILVSLVFLFVSLNQCTADTVWGIPRADFREQLLEGEREFLEQLPIEERKLAEAFRLGPGAPFYLSEIFFSLAETTSERAVRRGEASAPGGEGSHRPESGSPTFVQTAEQLLDLQWRRGDSPWREEAALALIRRYLDTDRFEEAESLARKLSRRGRETGIENRANRDLLEALYWQEKDQTVLSLLEKREALQAPWDDELDLYRAVSNHRLQQAGWRQLFIDLFFRKPTSRLHARAYAYLEQGDELDRFDPEVSLYFQGKDMLYRGLNDTAIETIEKSLSSLQPERLDMQILLRELGAAYFAVARYGAGAEALLSLSGDLPPAEHLAGVEMAGRLYRKGGNFGEARELLLEVVSDSGEAEQRDRAVWFLLDMAAKESSGRLIESIEQLAPRWHEPDYFSDLLEAQISSLAARRDWPGLISLYGSLKGYGPADTTARLAYLAGRAVSLGLADASTIPLSAQALYLEARSVGTATYYGFLAESALAGMGFPVRWSPEEMDRRGPDMVPDNVKPAQPAAEVIRGYFDYGLHERGTELLRSQWRSVAPELLMDAAMLLHERGEYLHSIRLMNLYVRGKVEGVERSDLELLYPRAYGRWIQEVSRSEGIPEPVFFALVREESHFDPGIVSRSGAVGLTQLMSETAADSARWLRMEEYDIRDAEQNLRLGARHFSRMFSRLEDIPKTLMAYNAGLSRLRRWERSFAGMPADLLVEAAPYPETRNYIRKILVSAVYYGALYYQMSLEQTVLLFFPGLEE